MNTDNPADETAIAVEEAPEPVLAGDRVEEEAVELTDRPGNPLEGLWHWHDHPLARFGIVIGVLAGIMLLLPILAQWTF